MQQNLLYSSMAALLLAQYMGEAAIKIHISCGWRFEQADSKETVGRIQTRRLSLVERRMGYKFHKIYKIFYLVC